MASLPRLAILLSTYNGEEFLDEQLDSILDQSGNVRVVGHYNRQAIVINCLYRFGHGVEISTGSTASGDC